MTAMEKDKHIVPTDLYYTHEHEWVRIESDGNAVIGITDYAQKSLHEVVYVDPPKVGSMVNHTEPIGTVESVKSVSEINSPLSGEIIKVNEKLIDSPEIVNESPYEDGWIAVMKPKALNVELKSLMTPEQYTKYVEQLLKSH